MDSSPPSSRSRKISKSSPSRAPSLVSLKTNRRTCSDVLPYFQHTGTCWFNAILMATLFSERSRNMLMNMLDFVLPPQIGDDGEYEFTEERHLMYLFKYIMNYKYYKSKNPMKDVKFHSYFKPEMILNILHKIYPKQFPNLGEGYYCLKFITTFYSIFSVKTLMFYVDNRDLYYHINNNFDMINDKINIYSAGSLCLLLHNKSNQPHVIIIDNIHDTLKADTNSFYRKYCPHYKIDVDKNNEDLLTLNDVIYYNGVKYHLDSHIIGNFNIQDQNHAIAGITCNKKKYLYNGWTKITRDTAAKGINKGTSLMPCDLYEFDWSPQTQDEICIDNEQCTFPNISKDHNPYNLCFSAAKGDRHFFYIRSDLWTDNGPTITKHRSFGHLSSYESSESKPKNICSTSSFSTKNRKSKCISYAQIIADIETTDINNCFGKSSEHLQLNLGKYVLSIDKIININSAPNIYYSALLSSIETDTHTKINVQISQSDSLIPIFELLSNIVINDRNPHFLMFYKHYKCNKKQEFKIDKNKYKYKVLPSYDVYLSEHFDGSLSNNMEELVSQSEDAIMNMVAQITFCIYSLHMYSERLVNSGVNHNITPFIVYQEIDDADKSGMDYICYMIDNTKHYLKCHKHVFQVYIYQDLYEINDNNVLSISNDYKNPFLPMLNKLSEKMKETITKILDTFDDLNDIMMEFDGNTSQEDVLNITLAEERKMLRKLLPRFTEKTLPENAIVLNDTPYYLDK